jgi:hypothetical protein
MTTIFMSTSLIFDLCILSLPVLLTKTGQLSVL